MIKRLFLCLFIVSFAACTSGPIEVIPTASPSPTILIPVVTPTVQDTSSPTSTFTVPPEPTLVPTSTATPPPVEQVNLTHLPYLQSVTPDSIIIAWDTDQPATSRVDYGLSPVLVEQVVDSARVTRHVVKLQGLNAYAQYSYRVGVLGALLSDSYTFRTAAPPDQNSFSFAVFGDTRSNDLVHQAIADAVLAQSPDFAIHTGDLVDNGDSAFEWNTFFNIEGKLMANIPLFTTLGNHEHNSDLYFSQFYLPGNQKWYAFDYGNARFISLDITNGIFHPEDEQGVWLKEELSKNPQPWTIVFFHVPPYFSQGLQTYLVPLFEQYHVNLVFNGHVHSYQRSELNGITYVVAGGGGAPLYSSTLYDPKRLVGKEDYNFVSVKIEGKTLIAVARTPEGQELDQFTLTLP